MSIPWAVTYWHDGLYTVASDPEVPVLVMRNGAYAEEEPDDVMRWRHLPTEGVLEVRLYLGSGHQGLRGMDNYWLHGDEFGVFNDPENFSWYQGYQAVTWRLEDGSFVRYADEQPPRQARVIRGIMVDDDIAREVGIL